MDCVDFGNCGFSGQSNGKKFYGGIGIHGKRGRSQFHVAVTNVATDVSSVEQVLHVFLIYAIWR